MPPAEQNDGIGHRELLAIKLKPEPIVPCKLLVASIQWSLDEEITVASISDLLHLTVPPNLTQIKFQDQYGTGSIRHPLLGAM